MFHSERPGPVQIDPSPSSLNCATFCATVSRQIMFVSEK